MKQTIKKTVSVLLLTAFVLIFCFALTGCGEEAESTQDYSVKTKRFYDGELLNLVEDEYQIVGKAVLKSLSDSHSRIDSIKYFDIAKWEYGGETYKGSGVGKYYAYGTCSAYDKYGDFYDSYKFEAMVKLEEKDYYEYTYYGDYSSSDAATSLLTYVKNWYSIEVTTYSN